MGGLEAHPCPRGRYDTRGMDSYRDGLEEKVEVRETGDTQTLADAHAEGGSGWKSISFDEIEVGEQIGGGSVGLVHRGNYRGRSVALKTLVSGCR